MANVPIGLKINIALSYSIEYQNGANYQEPQGTWHTKSRDLAITKNCIQWNYVKVVMPGQMKSYQMTNQPDTLKHKVFMARP